MTYTRIFADADGVSHFGTVEEAMKEVNYAPPMPAILMGAPHKVSRAIVSVIPAGFHGDWHNTPVRQLFVQLTGRIDVEVSDGERRQFGAGEVVLLEDTHGKGHVTMVVNNEPARAMFIQLAE